MNRNRRAWGKQGLRFGIAGEAESAKRPDSACHSRWNWERQASTVAQAADAASGSDVDFPKRQCGAQPHYCRRTIRRVLSRCTTVYLLTRLHPTRPWTRSRRSPSLGHKDCTLIIRR